MAVEVPPPQRSGASLAANRELRSNLSWKLNLKVRLMKNYRPSQRLLFFGLTVVVAGSASVVAGRWWPSHTKVPSSPPSVSTEMQQTRSSNQSSVSGEVEMIKLTAKGFEPAEITRPRGKFLLAVTNRTNLPDLSLRLVHENRRSLDTKRLVRDMNWRRVLDLPPGHYSLREASHPDWLCRITIEPH
jgi:hypothetical protein